MTATPMITPNESSPLPATPQSEAAAPSNGASPIAPEDINPPVSTDYALAFLFSTDHRLVALIEKQKPEWQKGLMNGIGGKVILGETPDQAVRREFHEETGLLVDNFRQFCVLMGETFAVYCYAATSPDIGNVRTTTDERVGVGLASDIARHPTIPNLQWLVPMALDFLANADAFKGGVIAY